MQKEYERGITSDHPSYPSAPPLLPTLLCEEPCEAEAVTDPSHMRPRLISKLRRTLVTESLLGNGLHGCGVLLRHGEDDSCIEPPMNVAALSTMNRFCR